MAYRMAARRLSAAAGCVFSVLFACNPANSQTTLSGAILFSTDPLGNYDGSDRWNTTGPDASFNLWLALHPDASSPVNGPSDAQAEISIPLQGGKTYRYYIFGQPGAPDAFYGLNLFFHGNNSVPGISVYEAANSSSFTADAQATLSLGGASAIGAGTTAYIGPDVVAVLSAFTWKSPATPPGDVCTATTFAPGNGPDYYGSFALQVFNAASLSASQPTALANTSIILTGSGFGAGETVRLYTTGATLGSAVADGTGSFSAPVRLPVHPFGSIDLFALGETSGKLGATPIGIEPNLIATPKSVAPGAAVSVIGSGEAVGVYLNNPRVLLGTPVTDSTGSFSGANALTATIPADVPPGINSLIGTGQVTGALAVREITVK